MRYEYIDPIITSTVFVLDQLLQTDVRRGDVKLQASSKIDIDTAVVLTLGNNAKHVGSVVLNMKDETAKKVSTAMHKMLGIKGDDGIDMDVISEMGNMVAGNIISTLNNKGCNLNISTPSVLSKDSLRKGYLSLESLNIPLYSEIGEMLVSVNISTD